MSIIMSQEEVSIMYMLLMCAQGSEQMTMKNKYTYIDMFNVIIVTLNSFNNN